MRNRSIILLICSLLICGVAVFAGDCEKCVVVQVDTCAQNGGNPPACDLCAGLFQPCYDKTCYLKNEDCRGPAPGSCTEEIVAGYKGYRRVCKRGAVSWSECFGQPKCVSEIINQIDGNRYTC